METVSKTAEEKSKAKPCSFRLTESVANDFNDKRKAVDMSANDFMQELLSMIDLSSAKEVLPGRKDEITQVEFYFREFMSVYVQSLAMYYRADEAAHNKYKNELENKKNMVCDLQNALKNKNEEFAEVEEEKNKKIFELKKENEELRNECVNLEEELRMTRHDNQIRNDFLIKIEQFQKKLEDLTNSDAEQLCERTPSETRQS